MYLYRDKMRLATFWIWVTSSITKLLTREKGKFFYKYKKLQILIKLSLEFEPFIFKQNLENYAFVFLAAEAAFDIAREIQFGHSAKTKALLDTPTEKMEYWKMRQMW